MTVCSACPSSCYLPMSQSLKDKRMVLRRLKDRLGAFNVAVAEVAHQEVWQRAGLAWSPSPRRTTVAEQTLHVGAARDRAARARPRHPEAGGVPPLTWPRDPVPNASASRSARRSAQLLLREVHDPGIGLVTLTRVKVSPDLQLVRVYYTQHRRREGAHGDRARARARDAVPPPPDRPAASGCAACPNCASNSTRASRTRTGSSGSCWSSRPSASSARQRR